MISSKKIAVMIVDDEPLARHGLREIFEEEKDIVIIAESSDGEEAVEHIKKYKPDVLFLDIQMPEMNGFDVVKSLKAEELPLVVFVTAYDEYAIKAFSANALDYILKPYDAERIHSSLHRVREMIRLKQTASYSERMMEALKSFQSTSTYIERISIRSAGKIYFVNIEEILWIEAAADYIYIHTKNGKHTTRETIGTIELQLDPSKFIRIHRSSIVNLNAVRELQPEHHGDYTAILDQGIKLTVSRKYKEKLSFLLE